MDSNHYEQLRHILEEELAALQQHINEEPAPEVTELSSVDNHPADAATDLTTVVTEKTLSEFKEEEIGKIEEALKAMDTGTYGKCSVCGKTIPFERLEAVPTALTCIDHADEAQ